MQENSVRLFWPDFVRAIALLLVVVVHTSGAHLNVNYFSFTPAVWITSLVFNVLGRCGVPLFFMLSGALLLKSHKQFSINNFLQKRAGRIFIAFIFWSLAFLIWRYTQHNYPLNAQAFMKLLIEPAYYHLWFFYSIIGLYLFTPLLIIAGNKGQNYISLLWLITVCAFFILTDIVKIPIDHNFDRVLPTFIGYFTIGAWLVKNEARLPKNYILLIIVIVSIVCTTFATWDLTIKNKGDLNGLYLNYLDPLVVFMSIALFVFLMRISKFNFIPWMKQSLCLISSVSLGIFALHPIIIESLSKGYFGFKLSASSWHPLIGFPFVFLVSTLISFLITFIMQKIPFVNKAV